jgi:hypothetical protein
MASLEDKFSSLYGTEAYGGVATVFLPGIQGASVTGPQGEKGPKGDTGDKGDRGPEGPQGTTGSTGAPGKNGATFFPTVDTDGNLSWVNDGSLSNPSTVNIKGPKGDKGDKGDRGPVGPQGEKGPKGDTGDKGDRGPEGPQGTTGSTGAPGKNGATFFPTVDTDGNLSWVNDGSLSNPSTVNIKGPKGDTGDIANLSSFTSDTIIAGVDSSKGVTSAKDINTAATSIAATVSSNATDTLKLSLATVATSGKYSDLSGLPDISSAISSYVGAQGFATSDEVSTTLTAYEKTADLNTTLGGYAKATDVAATYLPLSGGTMTGGISTSVEGILVGKDDTVGLRISGGTGWSNGASVVVYGKSHATYPGMLRIKAEDGTNEHILLGKPDGTLTWGGKNIVRSVNNVAADAAGNVPLATVATSGSYNDLSNKPSIPDTPKAYVKETWKSGTSWYRVWSDGWIEQGGDITTTGKNLYTVTLNKAFSTTDYFATCIGKIGSVTGNGGANYCSSHTTTTFKTAQFEEGARWYACGY